MSSSTRRGGGNPFKRLDLFFKMEEDLMADATLHGSVLSLVALVFMVMLFLVELSAFMTTEFVTEIDMDTGLDTQMRVSFNITLPALSCDYATVDLLDMIGTNRLNVTKNIEKWQIDKDGNRKMYQGRNRDQREVNHDNHLHPELHVLHENGVHAEELSGADFAQYTSKNEFVFADFYAPWCIWCQRLEPTWEKFAEDVEEQGYPVKVVKVNCVENQPLCKEQHVAAFPTLRFLRYGEVVTSGDFRSDRTVDALMDFVKRKMDLEHQYKQWPEARKAHAQNWNPDHPGCLIVGYLLVNRVPGNFHIEARSKNHNINAASTNLSHTVNHLSFGMELTGDQLKRVRKAQAGMPTKFSPLDDMTFAVPVQHQAHHHYIKVVNTVYRLGRGYRNKMSAYQMLTTNQVMRYGEQDVPEAKFHYDVSPMAVTVTRQGRQWYDFLTSTLSIIGGTITVLGLVDGLIYRILKPKKA